MATAIKAPRDGPNRVDILERLGRIEEVQNKYIFEREDVSRAIIISLVIKAHLLLTGPPGIAKTTQIRLAAHHVIDSRFFHTQLSPFSTVEDVFGPVDLQAYKTGDRRRVSQGMLQEADVAVVDEIYNGNEAVLKALLAPMNEGVFAEHGRFQPIPLRTLMGAANQIPDAHERRERGLAGFHDRWLFRFAVDDIKNTSNFTRMLWTPDIDFYQYEPDPKATVTIAELELLQAEVERVRLPVGICEELVAIRKAMEGEGLYCSPRRWKRICRALKASALLDQRYDVEEQDLSVLRHTLWSEVQQIPVLDKVLEPYLASREDRAAAHFSRILELYSEFDQRRRSTTSLADISKIAFETRLQLEHRIQQIRDLQQRSYSTAERESIEGYLQRAYGYLKELDEAAGM